MSLSSNDTEGLTMATNVDRKDESYWLITYYYNIIYRLECFYWALQSSILAVECLSKVDITNFSWVKSTLSFGHTRDS